MADTVRVTKKDNFARIAEILEGMGATELVAFVGKEIAAIEAKAERARIKAAEAKAAPDALKDLVMAALGAEPMTRTAIFDMVEGEIDEVTVGKVTNRLTKLVNEGVAVREDIKVEVDGKAHTVKGYALA